MDLASLPSTAISLIVRIITSREFFLIVFFPGFLNILLVPAIIMWFERKLIARVQLRIGPLYAGGMGGILQPVADGIKLMFKEMIFPEKADKPLFMLVPLALMLIAATPFAVIPFGENWVIANIDVSLAFVFAVISLFPSLILLIAWASNSKYPFLGGLRSLFQQVAYEIPMWLSALGVVMSAGSLNLVEIVRAQSRVWFIFPQILAFVAFICCVMAELERIPFDLPTAEPELVMGWMTELSGVVFMISFLALYAKLYMLSALVTILFLGGWLGPAFFPQPVWFLLKTFGVAAFMVIVRGVFPRVRVDLLLRAGWTRLLMIALANVVITALLLSTGLGSVWRP